MDIDPEKREGLLEASVLQGNQNINGLSLRPVTSATWSLLTRLDNPFITGVQNTDHSFAVYSFVWLHSKPLSEVRRLVSDTGLLRATVYEWMDTRPVGEMFSFVPWITQQVEMVALSITKPDAPTGLEGLSPKA